MKRTLGAVVVLLVAVLASVSIVNAASLDLTRPSMTTTTITDRCAAALGATSGIRASTGSASSVVLTGLTADCAGRRVSLTLFKADGTVVATVSDTPLGEVSDGEATLTVPVFPAGNIDGIALTIGTWGIPATWTKPPPLPLTGCSIIGRPDVACSATLTSFTAWETGFDAGVSVSTTPATPDAEWQITFNFADPQLPQPIRSITSEMFLAQGTTCESLPVITFVGRAWENKTNQQGRTRAFSITGHTDLSGSLLSCN